MQKYFLIISSILIIVTFITCSSNKKKTDNNIYHNKIIGYWERVGDVRSGLVISVEQISNQDIYIGKIILMPEKFEKIYKYGEIIWQNVNGINNTQWEGNVVLKGESFFGDVVVEVENARFFLVNENLIEIYLKDVTQKWIRKRLDDYQ